MLGLDDARALLASWVSPLAPVERPLAEVAGHLLAEIPLADADLPPADLSAMDGYAARAADLAAGAPLPVAFAVPAGGAPEPLPPGAVARIFTGAVVPAGADTVVPQEEAEMRADGRVLLAALPRGSNVRPRGEIFTVGAPLAAAGDRLTPARLGTLTAGGAASVRVFPRPRLAILVTGAELVEGATHPARGQIRDSNGPMLAALARQAELPLVRQGRVADDLAALRAALADAAAAADLVVTSGGVSVGDFDLLPRAVGELSGETVLHKVAIQPGKPVLVARLGETWLVGLPGNPVSVLAAWRMFGRPLAEALAGDGIAFDEAPLIAALPAPARNPGGRTQLRPAVLAVAVAGLRVTVLPWKGSHDILSAAPANCLARLEPGVELAAGTPVPCYPLPWRWNG